jgi:LysR family hca operon transcriptional activator
MGIGSNCPVLLARGRATVDGRHLRYFIAVAEELNFTRAAERLHTVQPSLSAQIRKLEEDIGALLFERDKHHVALTAAGRVFLQEARAIQRNIEHAVFLTRQTARVEAGHITMGSIVGTDGKVLSHVLPALRGRHPEIQLSLRSMTNREQIEALQNREINIGLLRGPIDDPAIVCETISQDTMLAVLPAGHSLAQLDRIPVSKLAKVPLVMVSRSDSASVHDITNRIAECAGEKFHVVLDTDNVVATLNAVGSALGFSLLPDYVRQILPANVISRPLDLDPQPKLDLLMAYRKEEKRASVTTFTTLIRECMSMWQQEAIGLA